jgi:hypothetical protein
MTGQGWIDVEEVTTPVGPGAPCVVAVIWPEVKRCAGPTVSSSDGSVIEMAETDPAGGSLTVGVGPKVMSIPPNRLTLDDTPKALPVTAVMEALEVPDDTMAATPSDSRADRMTASRARQA